MAEKSPILNNPYTEPLLHYSTDLDGNLDYSKILEGRRPYSAKIGISPNHIEQPTLFSGDDFADEDANAVFINSIRDAVKCWREAGYPHTTKVTRDLLNFWFCNNERQNEFRLFFCQREAVETAVYFNEVADTDPNVGRSLIHQLEERLQTISEDYNYILPRIAFKMATGTGKTVVMAMLILYNYLNKKANMQDTRFADHFLLVTPGITIKDRLSVLYIDENQSGNPYDKNDYYHQRQLIPQAYQNQLGGLNSVITITNYQQFEPKVFSGKKSSPMDGKLVYEDGQLVKKDGKESFSSVLSRIIGRNMKGKRIVVINDEAHHCYLPKASNKGGDKESADENEKAMVWYEGLRQMKLTGYKLQHVYDLSATPYYLSGSGHVEYSLFPWVVSDFGLVDAIESGLVKIPFLPKSDDTAQLSEPVLRNIYEHIKGELPRVGQRTQRRRDLEEGVVNKVESVPNLPALLNLAIDQFVKDYEDYNRGVREEGEAEVNLFTTPPVFIVVCNNTTVSKEVFKHIAGYESVDASGNKIYVPGKYDIFSNYSTAGIPLSKQPTLLIDSAAIENAGGVVSDEFKSVFRNEIDVFKREYSLLHGAGSADKLTDGDILREVVNTVGKRNALGSHIRCVVSVSMLTEGWDANTVTHVCGVRAFGSQLLCEQVAGRALRRRSYDLLPYTKEGEEIPVKDIKRYKPENIVWKFPPEYAHIIGIPFKTFKGGNTAPPPPPISKTIIKALPERNDLEIVFPNIISYRSETPDGAISADYTDQPKFRLNFTEIPTKTTLGTAVNDKIEVLKTDFRELRDAQVIYELTRRLISIKYTDVESGRQFQKFAALKHIVEQWYETQVEIIGGDGSLEQRRLVLFWDQYKTTTSIYEGIRASMQGDERITAILNYYNPEGSTCFVHGSTSKDVYETIKSHVNYVVADTESWEQKAAKALEDMDCVLCYVKNNFLDFKIPYIDCDIERNYVPDFIAVIKTPSGKLVNLIIEISGFSNDRTGNKDAKRYYTEHYWLPAANNIQKYGKWAFVEITDIDNIKAIINNKISTL